MKQIGGGNKQKPTRNPSTLLRGDDDNDEEQTLWFHTPRKYMTMYKTKFRIRCLQERSDYNMLYAQASETGAFLVSPCL